MALYFNITGASSAAAELTRELLIPGNNSRVKKIQLTNIQGVYPCTFDLYIEKVLKGKFYLLKGVELSVGTTFTYEIPKFKNSENEFGLYLKLNKSASEIPSVDVILY